MKKILHTFMIVGIFIIGANNVFALNYKSVEIPTEKQDNVNEKYVYEAKLLEDYIIRFTQNIQSQAEALKVEDSQETIKSYSEILAMKRITSAIQSGYIPEKYIQQFLKEIVIDIKSLNIRLKKYFGQVKLKQEQILQAKQLQYQRLSEKIYTVIDNFIDRITQVLLGVETLTPAQRSIVHILLQLREENQKIKNFGDINFENEDEMKAYLKERILRIQKYMRDIKNTSH